MTTGQHATSADCPCCYERIQPGEDTDTALVAAFIGGVMAVQTNVPMAEALCAKHSDMCRDALEAIMMMMRAGVVPR